MDEQTWQDMQLDLGLAQQALNESDYMQWAAINDVCSIIENPLIDHVQFVKELTAKMTDAFITRAMKESGNEK